MYDSLFIVLLFNPFKQFYSKLSIEMSSQNVVVDAIENVAPDAEKQKKPTLAGKYSKLLNFGFWFSSMLESEELKTQLYNQLRLFGSIEEQTELFERFLAEEKEVAKTIRKCIAEHNKPPKPVKEKAAKAPRKGKAVVHQDKLISQLIADANADPIADKPDEEAARLAKEEADRLAKEAKEVEKEAARLAKEEADRLAKEAKEVEKEAARLAKEEADRLAKEAKEAARLAKDEEARVAKEEAARLAKEAKELKEAENVVAKLEKEAAAALAKKAKAAEKQAKEDAAILAKAAKEQEKANKAKPVKKTSIAKSVPVDVQPIANEVIEKAVEEAPIAPIIANEVIEKAVEPLPIAPIIGDELVAEVIEDDEPIAKKPDVIEESNQPKASKSVKPAKEPKAAKEPKSEKKSKKTSKQVYEVVDEVIDIHTRIIVIQQKEYLIDQNNTLYDRNPPNAIIGTYNSETRNIEYQ
jgi:hypothetical protein